MGLPLQLDDVLIYESFECIVVYATLSTVSTVIACVYRPPGVCYSVFLDNFTDFVGFPIPISKHFLICDDLGSLLGVLFPLSIRKIVHV